MKKPTALDILTRRAAEKDKAIAVPTQLDFWPEKVRGVPNTFARCALFTASGKSEPRMQFKDHVVFSVQGFTLTYSGEELRQDDQDVFLQLVHMMRAVPIGHMIEATGYGILSALGWGSGGKDYSRLRTSIERLARTNIEIKGEDLLFIGRLLPSMTRVGSTASSRFSLWLDPNVIKLFGKDMYSMVDWEDRLSLSVLAKWLHSFYFTHREPKAYRVDTLHQLCGSKQKELRVFKQKLRLALEELVVIKFLVSFEIMGNLVAVQRQHQLRQLNS